MKYSSIIVVGFIKGCGYISFACHMLIFVDGRTISTMVDR